MGNISSLFNQGSGNYGSALGGGSMMPYSGSPVMMGNGLGNGQAQGPMMGQNPSPVNTILTPVNSPAPGPGGGSNSPPNYAYYGQPGQGSGQMSPGGGAGASPTMGSK